MDGVTDAVCRYISKTYGNPDVVYTEYVSAEGLWRIKKRGEMDHKIWNELKYDESERPVVAQLFGSDPDSFYEAAKIVVDLGFDGIDINMGCPSPGLEKREGGAGLMRSRERAREVIEATRRGVEDWAKRSGAEMLNGVRSPRLTDGRAHNDGVGLGTMREREIPVSVKTRVGSTKPDEEWWNFLAEMRLPAVAMHGRTFRQLYSGKADWGVLKEAGQIIRASGALFLGNGDVLEIKGRDRNDKGEWSVVLNNGEGRSLDGFDGVLVGRAAIGNPWVLRKDGVEPSREERLRLVLEHALAHEKLFPGYFMPARKHFAAYVKGMADAKELRKWLVRAEKAEDVRVVIETAIAKETDKI